MTRLSQRRSVTLFTTLWQLFWESADILCRNIISERFCNDIVTLSQRSHNVELLAGRGDGHMNDAEVN